MIRINLLPVRASKKREAGKQWLALFVLVTVASLVGNYFWYSDAERRLTAINQRIVRYQKDVQTLNKIIGEVKNIKAEKKEMEDKLAILRKLRDGRTGPVRVLDELSNIIPQRLWVKSWDDNDGAVSIQGSAINHEEVSTFLKKLKASKFFSDPVLKFTRQTGEARVDFQITARVVYDAPQG